MQRESAAARRESTQARRESAEAQAGIQTEAALGQCISFLGTKKAEGVTFDRPVTRDNACDIARQLGMKNG